MSASAAAGTEEEKDEKPVKEETNEEPETVAVDPPATSPKENEAAAAEPSSPGSHSEKGPDEAPESPAPMAQPTAYPQLYAPHLTPQQGAGAYAYMYNQAQVTPEQQSPAYDSASFRQQFNPFGGQYAGGLPPPPPLSPRVSSLGSLPPASPLFPRAASNAAGRMSPGGNGTPASPAPYLHSPGLGAAIYQTTYGGTPSYGGGSGNGNGTGSDASPEDTNAWSNRSSQQLYSPQLYGGSGLTRSSSAGSRTYSFDEMLPPAVLDTQDQQGNPTYSPYQARETVGTSGTLFAQQSWGYGPPGDMYNAPPSPVPPRPVLPHMPGGYGAPRGGPPPYGGPYYPATSPGPPIQTTASNKGPDGSNLFIFHIPNHFTNLDMYNLFAPYGNLLSVRIMVERDTGRSRGFGFVSYDNPDSAAMAIKELNGFAIGNKRLKVQHKQIRAGEREQHHHDHSPGYHPPAGGGEYPSYGGGGEYGSPSADATSPHSAGSWYNEPESTPLSSSQQEHEGDARDVYEGKSPEEEGADIHRSGLGNLDTLRTALPDIAGPGTSV